MVNQDITQTLYLEGKDVVEIMQVVQVFCNHALQLVSMVMPCKGGWKRDLVSSDVCGVCVRTVLVI